MNDRETPQRMREQLEAEEARLRKAPKESDEARMHAALRRVREALRLGRIMAGATELGDAIPTVISVAGMLLRESRAETISAEHEKERISRILRRR